MNLNSHPPYDPIPSRIYPMHSRNHVLNIVKNALRYYQGGVKWLII